MIFVKTFKGYEDKTVQIDQLVNDWIKSKAVDVITVKTALGHPPSSAIVGGELIYSVIYRANAPIE